MGSPPDPSFLFPTGDKVANNWEQRARNIGAGASRLGTAHATGPTPACRALIAELEEIGRSATGTFTAAGRKGDHRLG
jgi:hypothetical protein